jgi:NAD(P)-dependent dehydrogenase (short-subunit alcohol dehydrogenase family)
MSSSGYTARLFDLTGRIAVITGGAGMLGVKHAEAIADMGGVPVLWDVREERLEAARSHFKALGKPVGQVAVDITDPAAVRAAMARTSAEFDTIDILINNAALTVESAGTDRAYFAPFEEYDVALWRRALDVSLNGAFLCSQAVGTAMARRRRGVILNIASDVGVISPDHRIYQAEGDYPGTPFNTPASYAVVKAGLIHLTRYLATYWAKVNVRVNALSPAGVYNNHDERFVRRLTHLIPMGRMATKDEYKGAVVFLVSDASAFLTGFNVVMDGGRTAW